MSLKVKDRMPGFLKAIDVLTRNEVLVGIPAERTQRDDGPITNAALGYIHEFGSPAANIPARPFLFPGVAGVSPRIREMFKKAGQEALSTGNASQVRQAMEAVGLVASDAVRQKIVEGPFVPLSPRTVAARKGRGVDRTHPLIDTGAMRQAVTYVVRPKNGKSADNRLPHPGQQTDKFFRPMSGRKQTVTF